MSSLQYPALINMSPDNNFQIQFGRTKLFIRTPELFREFEHFRTSVFEAAAAAFQRAWERYKRNKSQIKARKFMNKFIGEVRRVLDWIISQTEVTVTEKREAPPQRISPLCWNLLNRAFTI